MGSLPMEWIGHGSRSFGFSLFARSRLEFRSTPRCTNGPHALLVRRRVRRPLRDPGLRGRRNNGCTGCNDCGAVSCRFRTWSCLRAHLASVFLVLCTGRQICPGRGRYVCVAKPRVATCRLYLVCIDFDASYQPLA